MQSTPVHVIVCITGTQTKYMRFVAALVHALSKVSFRLLEVIRSKDPELVEERGELDKVISMPRSSKSSIYAFLSAFI